MTESKVCPKVALVYRKKVVGGHPSIPTARGPQPTGLMLSISHCCQIVIIEYRQEPKHMSRGDNEVQEKKLEENESSYVFPSPQSRHVPSIIAH